MLALLVPNTGKKLVVPRGSSKQFASHTERQVRMTVDRRRAVRAIVERFLATAARRRDLSGSYDLATGNMRQGQSRAEWLKGNIPVMPYEARGNRGAITFDFNYRDRVGLDLFVQPERPAQSGPAVFFVELHRTPRGWLVDQWGTRAVYPPTEPVAAQGKSKHPRAQTRTGPAFGPAKARLSPLWFLVPGALLVLGIAAVLIVALRSWLQGRRALREYHARNRID